MDSAATPSSTPNLAAWATRQFIDLAERGLIPDFALRAGIRRLCTERLRQLSGPNPDAEQARRESYIEGLRRSPIAMATREANTQHYEVPTEFYLRALGPQLKYSSAYYPKGYETLGEAETLALGATIERAELRDGHRILELGCGWGSLTLAMARRFPLARITAISNSRTQKQLILERASAEKLTNIEVITRNVAEPWELPKGYFDRVVSVEMFEHMKNYGALLERIASVLAPGGKLFVHIFTHRSHSYPFETEGEDNWMGRYFFTGGQMPSAGLLARFQEDLRLESQWAWSGKHYARTANDWLRNQDSHREEILRIFKKTYGSSEDASRWFHRWRIFFMSCAELFGYRDGSEWGVTHYRFQKPANGKESTG